METIIPLDKMSTSDKLRALEEIWEGRCRTPEDVPSPSWHADVVQAREKRIQEGPSQFTEWREAKRTIRDRVK